MAIERVGEVGASLDTGSIGTGTTTTLLSLNLSSVGPIVEGDLIIISAAYGSSTAPSTTAPTWGSPGQTITQLGTWQTYGTQRYVGTAYLVFNGRTNTNVTTTAAYVNLTVPATANHCALAATIWRGVDQTTPIDATTTEGVTASGTSHDLPSITTVTDGAVVISTIGGSNDNGSGGSVFSGVSSGWTFGKNRGTTTGNDVSVAQAYKEMPSAGSSGTVTYTSSAAVTAGGQTVALRPASTPLPASTYFVSKSAPVFTNATGGWTKSTGDPEALPARGPLTAQTGDLAVAFAWQTATGAALFTAPSGWTSVIEQDYGTTTLQVYVTPWTSGMSWPSWTSPSTATRFETYGLILRGIDTNTPINTSNNSDVTTASTTVTMPSVTPNADDCVVIKGAFLQNDNWVTTDPTTGHYIVSSDTVINSTQSAVGSDQATFLILHPLTGGSGASTGTDSVTQSSSNAYTSFTIAFNKASAANVVQRTASDSSTGTESATGLTTRPRTASDSALGTESTTSFVTVRRTASDSAVGFESVSNLHIHRRTSTDSALGTQTAVGARKTFATGSGTATGSETAVSRHVHVRTGNDSALGTQTTTDTHIHVRSATGSGAGTESASFIRGYSRTVTDSGAGTESASGTRIVPRTGSDTGTGSESVSGVRTTFRSANGTGTSDSDASSGSFAVVRRTASDNSAGSESAFWLLTAKRTGSASGTGTESATGVRVAQRTGSDTGTGSETASGQHIHQRSASDSATGSESASRVVTHLRTASDSVTSSETAANRHVHVRTGNDSALGTQTADGGISSVTKQRTATGAGTSSESSSSVHRHSRLANGFGNGTEATTCVRKVLVTAAASPGTGSETVSSRRICTRTATAAGTSSESAIWSSVSGMFFGSSYVSAIKAGTTNVSRVYVGSTRVWN